MLFVPPKTPDAPTFLDVVQLGDDGVARLPELTCPSDHPPFEECAAKGTECLYCGVRDCPHKEPLHYHHDGCPSCGVEVSDATEFAKFLRRFEDACDAAHYIEDDRRAVQQRAIEAGAKQVLVEFEESLGELFRLNPQHHVKNVIAQAVRELKKKYRVET